VVFGGGNGPGLFARLKAGLSRTHDGFVNKVERLVLRRNRVDAALLDELEELYLQADVGPRTTDELMGRLRRAVSRGEVGTPEAVLAFLKAQALDILAACAGRIELPARGLGVILVVGTNGSGKTTTVNILTTLLKADGGTASVAGFDVAEQSAEVREQISLTGQFAAVDHVLTARENLVLIGELRHVADPRRTAADLLDKFELNEAADRRLLTFSGGMRRRLDIAMSLVGDASVIFFDEPTTGLDPKGRTDMWLTIRHLAENGTTVFLTTQYLEEADRLADEIAILHGGRIVAGGTPDELKAMVPTGLVALEFGEEEHIAVAQRALGVQYEVSREGSTLVVATTGSVAEMADLFIRLNDSGIEPAGFSRQLPTLDDVFFKFLDEEKDDRHASAR
jgi:ABC-2 type transport system ATP-binding protein